MLKNVKVGDKVVAFPYGVGAVKSTKSGNCFQVIVGFENADGVMSCHAFSLKGEVISWPNVVSCWTIKNAPSWIWERFEKPKVTEPFEKCVLVTDAGRIQKLFDTSEERQRFLDKNYTTGRKAKITGEIEYE